MKYSEQQIIDINLYYANLKRDIQLTNMRTNGIQSVVINKNIDPNMLDSRNSNDIENDKIAREQEFFRLSMKLFYGNSGEVNILKQKLNKNNLMTFYLNHFPRILQESKGFRKATSDLIFSAVLRLYDKMMKHIKQNNQLNAIENSDKLKDETHDNKTDPMNIDESSIKKNYNMIKYFNL